eukprot:CAMPEP_0115835362 /NCGR_PEP_ID=MMETSP0287-20121206/4155_1 /TAXON_ID=412157 /ORGANISM="Chrysochromulina rotalis, Strain UIO044" /LENGTH=450 /DNA_ID=CAMNT_0003288817 /DNA_START=60 /DNA_END=1412 /DNA_ORIENTATION=+
MVLDLLDKEAQVVTVQACARAFVAVKKFSQQRAAVIQIQARVRGRVARKGFLERQRAKLSRVLFSMFSGWGSPVRASVNSDESHRLSPADAGWIERVRDWWLASMASVEHWLIAVAAVLGIALVAALGGVVVLFFPLNLGVNLGSMSEIVVEACNESRYNESWVLAPGTDSMPPRVDHPSVPTVNGWTTEGLEGGKYVSFYCTPAQYWFNICCKYLSFYFGYVNLLPVPWTLSILIHSYFNRPGLDDGIPSQGFDFYGRPTESMWFHLPLKSRKRIAMLNLIALLLQIPDCLFHACIFWEYLEIQIWPGNVMTNLPLVGQLSMQVAAAYLLVRAEGRVRRSQPNRFAPTMGKYLVNAYSKWSELRRQGELGRFWLDDVCCGPNSFVHFVRVELRQLRESQKQFIAEHGTRRSAGITGIDIHSVIGQDASLKGKMKSPQKARTTKVVPVEG